VTTKTKTKTTTTTTTTTTTKTFIEILLIVLRISNTVLFIASLKVTTLNVLMDLYPVYCGIFQDKIN
jgi:hypothetical protein